MQKQLQNRPSYQFNIYSNPNQSYPNQKSSSIQQPSFPLQKPIIKKTFSQYEDKYSNRSSINSQNIHTKMPKVIFDLIGQHTRQQNLNRIRNSKDNQNKKSLIHKSRKSIFQNKNKQNNLFDDQIQSEEKPQPTGTMRRTLGGKIPQIDQILSSRNKSTCPICLVQGKKKDFISISENQCDHLFCRSCMHQYVIFKIKMFQKVTCPDQGCKVFMKITSHIYSQLPLDTRQKFKKITQYNQVLETKTKRICPNENCSGILDIANPTINPRCPQCKIVYCHKCYFKNHAGDCDPFQLNFFTQTLNYRQCSKCLNMIEKNQGCNHMTCRCGYQFCYLCGQKWKSTHNCQGIGQQPYVRETWDCCCCQCQQCDICDPLDYLCECFCFDDWQICQIRPIRYLSKFIIIILLIFLGLPIWLLYMIVNLLIRIAMGLIMGLLIVPCAAFFDQQGNCKWFILGIIFLPITILILIVLGIKEVIVDEGLEDLAQQFFLPCQVVNEIIQL